MGTFNDGDSGSSIRTKINTAIQKTEGTSAISTIDVDGGAIDGVTLGTNSAVTEAQVDNININGNTISSTDTNGDVIIDPNGTGNVKLGNFEFDADQTVGSGQDNYVLTYDHSSTSISLEAAAGGGGGAYNLISTTTITTATTSIDLTFSGGYKKYVICYAGLETSSDADAYITLRVSTDGGSSFISTANYMYRGEAWGRNSVDNNTGGSIQSTSTGNDRIHIYDPQSASNVEKSGTISIFDPTNSSLNFHAYVNYIHVNSNDGLVFGAMGASYAVDGDYDAIRIGASSGIGGASVDFTSGIVKFYGVS